MFEELLNNGVSRTIIIFCLGAIIWYVFKNIINFYINKNIKEIESINSKSLQTSNFFKQITGDKQKELLDIFMKAIYDSENSLMQNKKEFEDGSEIEGIDYLKSQISTYGSDKSIMIFSIMTNYI